MILILNLFKIMKSKVLQFLIHYESIGVRIVQILLFFLILIRFITIFKISGYYVDTRYFIETSKLILQGISPYYPEKNPTIFIYPAQAPSMSLICMPLCILPETIQNILFVCGGAIAYYAYVMVVFSYYGFSFKEKLNAQWSNIPIWVVFTMVCISSPYLMMLRHGQNSSFAALFLFIMLFYPSRDKSVFNIIMLALAAAMKYSMLTMQVPVLIVQKRWRVSIMAFLLFIIMVLAVGLWLDGIIPAFKEYVQLLLNDSLRGANSYSNKNSFSFIHIGFFKYEIINFLLKIIMVLMYLFVIYRIWKSGHVLGAKELESLTAAEWALFTTLTLLMSYHREYDGVLFMPFLGVVFLESYYYMKNVNMKNVFNTLWLLWILFFWAMPKKYVYLTEAWIGEHITAGEMLFLNSHNPVIGAEKVFPITKLMVLITAFYLFAVVLSDNKRNGIRKIKSQ